MIDWPGLLKFSSTYHDKNFDSSHFKPLSKEDKEFLEKALEEYSFDHIKEMKTNLQELQRPDISQDEMIECLENLQDLIEGQDLGIQFCQIEGLPIILNIILKSGFSECRIIATQIFSSINQNSAEVQSLSFQIGGLDLVNVILNEKNNQVRENVFSALSSMIRGEYLQGKRDFLTIDGVQLLDTILKEENLSMKLKMKTLYLLKDLVFYDDRLKYTYNNLSPFANTNQKVKALKDLENLSKQAGINKDINKELIKNNELQENKKFHNLVKKTLIELNIFQYQDQLFFDEDYKNVDTQSNYIFIITQIIKYDRKLIDKINVKGLEFYSQQLQKLTQSDNTFDYDVQVLNELQNELSNQTVIDDQIQQSDEELINHALNQNQIQQNDQKMEICDDQMIDQQQTTQDSKYQFVKVQNGVAVPTNEYQILPDNINAPVGCEFKINFTTGQKLIRLEQNESNSNFQNQLVVKEQN